MWSYVRVWYADKTEYDVQICDHMSEWYADKTECNIQICDHMSEWYTDILNESLAAKSWGQQRLLAEGDWPIVYLNFSHCLIDNCVLCNEMEYYNKFF